MHKLSLSIYPARERCGVYDRLFIVVLFLSFFIRLYYFDYPLINGESHRDYLVGKHIVQYQELPLTGPCCLWNSTFGAVRNNPVYYYFIAGILAVYDDIMFLGFINILLQVLSVAIVYFFARYLFSASTAFIAVLLFATNPEVLRQSLFFWQPHAMLPFMNLSFFFLVLAFLKKCEVFMFLSIFFFLFSASLHNSVYAILPIFVIVLILILKKQGKKLSTYLKTASLAIGVIILFYFPWVLHFVGESKTTISMTLLSDKLFTSSVFQVFDNLLRTIAVFSNTFLPNKNLGLVYAGGFFIIGSFLFYIIFNKRCPQKTYFFILLFAVLQFMLVASLFKATFWFFYLTPILSLIVILIAEVVNTVLSKRFIFRVLKILFIALLAYINIFSFRPLSLSPSFENYREIRSGTKVIGQELVNIRKEEKFDSLNFFRLKVYAKGIESPVTADLPFWSLLEKDFNTRFIKIVDRENSYEFINKDIYIFVVCQSYPVEISQDSECLLPFFNNHKKYIFIKSVYNQAPFSIYLAKKH